MTRLLFALLLCAALVSWLATSASGSGYKLAPLTAGMERVIHKNRPWEACGKYFAAIATGEERILLFAFKNGGTGRLPTPFFIPSFFVDISFNNRVSEPEVILEEGGLILIVNAKDYRDGLPCLAKGGILM